jgi:hypothetical protein
MKKQKTASDVPYKMDEERKQEMRAFLKVVSDRIEVLECLDIYAHSFPDWLVKITEGIQSVIDRKQGMQIPCDDEKEILSNMGYFFTKMAYFNGLISQWRKEMAGGKEATEEMLDKM